MTIIDPNLKQITIDFCLWAGFMQECAEKGYEVITGRIRSDIKSVVLVSGVPFHVAAGILREWEHEKD